MQSNKKNTPEVNDPYETLENSVYAALQTYANVHRGSGHASKVTSHLYEKAREIVADYLEVDKKKYAVLFCSPYRAGRMKAALMGCQYKETSSADFGLKVGVVALAIKKQDLPRLDLLHSGGGTTRLYGADWVMWAKAPARYEAGTPAIINCIAFACALQLVNKHGKAVFRNLADVKHKAVDILFDSSLNGLSGKSLLTTLQKQWVGYGVTVPGVNGPKPMINLDNSASTLAFEPVWEAFRKAYRLPDSAAPELIREVEKIVSRFFGAPLDAFEVVFTSNTTEAINLLADDMTASASINKPADTEKPIIVSSVLEHSSNDLPWRNIPGHAYVRIAVNKDGFFDLVELERLLTSNKLNNGNRIKLVAVSGASNVIGTCNDLNAIARLTKKFGVHLLVDAAQLAAHRKIDMEALGIDYLVFSGHKTYAPFGSGALIARKGLINSPLVQRAKTSGMSNLGGIAALGKALRLLQAVGFEVLEAEEQSLLALAWQGVSKLPGVKLYGIPADNIANLQHRIGVLAFEQKNKLNSSLANNLMHNGAVGVRYGCLCAHVLIRHLLDFTPVQEKIQKFVLGMIPAINLQGVLRVSFGLQNTSADVEVLLENLQRKGRIPKKQLNDFIKLRASIVYG